jgi:hypothetical protein
MLQVVRYLFILSDSDQALSVLTSRIWDFVLSLDFQPIYEHQYWFARILNEVCIATCAPDILGVGRDRRIHWHIVNMLVSEWEDVASLRLIAFSRLLSNRDEILLEILESLGLVMELLWEGSFHVKASSGVLLGVICDSSEEDAVLQFIIEKKVIERLIDLVSDLTWKTTRGILQIVLNVAKSSRVRISAEDIDVLEQIEEESAAENVRELIGDQGTFSAGTIP